MPRNSLPLFTVTVVVLAVVAVWDSEPVTLAISMPLFTLIAVPAVRSVAAVPKVRVPAPFLVIVRAVPSSPSPPKVSPFSLLKLASPESVVAPAVGLLVP